VDPVKRKVISELFFAPSVVLPIVGGLSAGLLSWAVGGNGLLNAATLLGLLGGVGWMLTRMIFKIEDITEQALQVELDKRLQAENSHLDALAAKLQTDPDHRTQDYLTLIRSMRRDFEGAAHQPGLQFRSAQIREKVSQVFVAVVDQLQQSYRLWELAERLKGKSRDKLLADRERVLREVEVTIDRLRVTCEQFEQLARTETKVDLAAMRQELDATMQVAKRTEERMRELNQLPGQSALRDPVPPDQPATER
jgi:paraquat-inducible protein B